MRPSPLPSSVVASLLLHKEKGKKQSVGSRARQASLISTIVWYSQR